MRDTRGKQTTWSWWHLLFIIQFIAVLWPPFYNKAEPAWIGIPFFYPGNSQEIIDYGLMAIAFSRFSGAWTKSCASVPTAPCARPCAHVCMTAGSN